MQHIDKIEKFFEFLEEHLESGFEKIKRPYSLRYYDVFFEATRNDNTDIDILVYQSGNIVTDPITGNEEYFDEYIYLNPFRQIKRTNVTKEGENNVITSYNTSLYNDLYQFYFNEFRKFKRKFYQSLVINFPSGNTKEFLTNFFIAIEDFQERAENPKFSVKNEKCEDIQLLNIFLQSLVDKIKQKYLNQESAVNNEKKKDGSTKRQAYIIHLLLEKAACKATDVQRADFAEFLTGKHKQNLRVNLRGAKLSNSDKDEIKKQFKLIGLDDFANDAGLVHKQKP